LRFCERIGAGVASERIAEGVANIESRVSPRQPRPPADSMSRALAMTIRRLMVRVWRARHRRRKKNQNFKKCCLRLWKIAGPSGEISS
jgi:hypothetical protein